MITKELTKTPVVIVAAGKAITSSKDVAAFFGKQHKNVIRDIRDLIAKAPSLDRLNFEPIEINDLTGVSTSHYEMDRDGFTLLAMGFTGERALKWKLRYIDAFNAMERQLHQQGVTVMPPALSEEDRKTLFGTFTKIARREIETATGALRQHMTEQNRHLWRALTKPRNAVHLQAVGFVELGGVYRLAGLEPGAIPAQGKLSGNIGRALDSFCRRNGVLVQSASIGTRDVTHWPKDAAVAWLADQGHEMIRNHITMNGRGKVTHLRSVS